MPALRGLARDLRTFAKYHLVRRVYDYPAPETELGVVGLDFDTDRFGEAVRARDERYEIEVLEELGYRERLHPMYCASSREAPGGAPTLLVLGGVHGNEHAGILAVPEILDRLARWPLRLVAVAPVNPVGAANLSRYNASGFDVNRDFLRFETPEARAVRRVVERKRPAFVVSLHEGPQDRTFMFLNRRVGDDLARRLADALVRGGTALATRDYFGLTLDPPGISPMSRTAWTVHWLWAKTLRMKSTGTWCDQIGIPEITLESSWRLDDRATRVRAHVDLVCALAAELSPAPADRTASGGLR